MADMTPEQTAAAIAAKMVKPLEWQAPSYDNNHCWIARSFFGDYYIHIDGGACQAFLEAHIKPYEIAIGEVVGNILTAQAAAQADHAARMIAEMDLSVLVGLVEALKYYADPRAYCSGCTNALDKGNRARTALKNAGVEV